METMRKEWGSPISKIQMFTPQEFVASCHEFIPAENVGRDFWVDLVHSNGSGGSGYTYSIGPDRIADEANVEHCLRGSTAPTNVYFHNVWYTNMTLYHKEVTSHDSGRTRYDDLNYFSPIAGYTDVAIYVGSGRRMWIFKGNNGEQPENPQWIPTSDKTFAS